MQRSETIIKIAPALLAAQKKIGSAVKGSKNPFFKSSYADLGAVMEACKEALNENSIAVIQPVGTEQGEVYVETVLLHESGEFISDRMKLSTAKPNDPQAQGSAITYARRYSLQSMVFIPAEDDDAEKATVHINKGKSGFDDIAAEYDESEKAEQESLAESTATNCEVCGKRATERKGITKGGKAYHGIFCSTGDKSHTKWLWN